MAKKPDLSFAPLGAEGYSYSVVHELVGVALRAGISVLMRGHPGVGKSSLAHQLAKEMGLELIDIRLAQRDPADLAGVYFPTADRTKLDLVPPAWALTAQSKPCLIFLDEINSAVTRLHQAAAYQIVLERRVGPIAFHKDTRILAAGNLEEDNAIVTTLSSALCNRFAHFVMKVDAADWLAWASEAKVHADILAYIGSYKEEVLYQNTGDVAFPTPRSWHAASQVYALAEEHQKKPLVAACVGMSAAEKFVTYLTIFRRIDAEKIIRKGEKIDFTQPARSEASFRHAAVFAVGHWIYVTERIADAELANIVKFARSRGLDPEYQLLFLQYLHSHDPHTLIRLRALAEYRALAAELVSLRVARQD